MNSRVYEKIISAKKAGRKSLAVLVDPDKPAQLDQLLAYAKEGLIDFFFVGGSLLTDGKLEACVEKIKTACPVPVVLFPGSTAQVDPQADALLLLSLISGRNAHLLIGQHVIAAPLLRTSGLELLPTGYMLIESGPLTTAAYMSHTMPIPRSKADIAACTALAGEQLGLKLIYLEAGSGAEQPVPPAMIRAVRSVLHIPLMAGGGIRTAEAAHAACRAGADVIVIGNAFEQSPEILPDIADAIHDYQTEPR